MSVSRFRCVECGATYKVKMLPVYKEIGCPACGGTKFRFLDSSGRQMIPVEDLKKHAHNIMEGLFFLAIVQSPNPEKAEALSRLQVLRLEIQELLDVIAPEAQK